HHVDDTVAQPPSPPSSQRATPFKITEVSVERGDQLIETLALRGHRAEHRRRPRLAVIRFRGCARGAAGIHRELLLRRQWTTEIDPVVRRYMLERRTVPKSEHQLDLVAQPIGAGTV